MKPAPPQDRPEPPGRQGPLSHRGGQVAILFALLLPVLALFIAGVLDVSFALNARTQLQDSNDEAGLATSGALSQNPNLTVAQLKSVAQSALAANFPGVVAPTITDFHVCAAVQNDCTDNGVQMTMDTIKLASSAPAACVLGAIVPMFCVGGSTQTVNADTLATVRTGKTLQINMILDSSASMIVGATTSDVNTIASWVSKNWSQVEPNDPAPSYPGGDQPPCAFACHDDGSTTNADIALGLTNAHAAGATTRFDVMVSAAEQLIDHVQTESQDPENASDTYLFNIYSFDTVVTQYGNNNNAKGKNPCKFLNDSSKNANLTFVQALAAITCVGPGQDTYLDNALTALAGDVGTNGTGNSASSPVKFVIIVTDGLQSDRSNNWNCSYWAMDPAWNYNTCYGGYAAPIDTTACQTMKDNGVIVAVLETPYVPLTGQDPTVAPYEKTVRHTIYPGGPSSQSVVSQALQACASSGFYYQSQSSSDIAQGFITLTDDFLARQSTLAQ
ncbi:MAG: TadE/TadG family type IV pilus assembly protein [Caulobacteraceae bacterium]